MPVQYPPKVALSRLVNSLKASSYFAGSCGGTPLSFVKDYIADQKRPD